MKLILRHPVWSALVFEAFLVLLFMLAPFGPCTPNVVGFIVLCFHFPAAYVVERVLGMGELGAALTAVLMVPVWIGLLVGLRRALRFRQDRSSSEKPRVQSKG